MKDEIIIYQPDDFSTKLEVRVEEDTIWLTQAQIVILFDSSKANISEHIKHIFETGELDKNSTVRKIRTVREEGDRVVTRELTHYNLDLIISIGYRVNSIRGTQFRIWANRILKDYLLKGYAFNNRMNHVENNMQKLTEKVEKIDLQIEANLPPNQGVDFTIFTKNISKQLKLDIKKYNQQYPVVKVKELKDTHDRFLIIDEKEIYHFGASLKDLGKKWFAFSKMEISSVKVLDKLKEGGLR